MADEQDRAESLDDDVVADEEDVIPEYPPDEPMGADDPGRFEIEDDVATRESRRSRE